MHPGGLMSSFTAPLTVTQEDEKYWRVHQSFCYILDDLVTGEWYVYVPALTRTDFASVPRLFWSVLPPYGEYTQAAVLHDYLYQQSEVLSRRGEPRTKKINRKECDQIFLESMEVLKVPRWKRKIMYWAVRLFGGKAWNRHN